MPIEQISEVVDSEYIDSSNVSIDECFNNETHDNVDHASFLNSEISVTVTNQIRRQEKFSNSYTHNGKLI